MANSSRWQCPWKTITSAHGSVVPFNYRVGGNWAELVKSEMSLYALEKDSRQEGSFLSDGFLPFCLAVSSRVFRAWQDTG